MFIVKLSFMNIIDTDRAASMCQALYKGFGVTKTGRALPQGLVKDREAHYQD